MPAFKDEQIIIIAPGSQTTLAQLGLPESFTPAKLRLKSRMFPAEKGGEWEPYKVRQRQRNPVPQEEAEEIKDMKETLGESEEEITYEEDPVSEEGAVWPIVEGKIVNWSCFFALMQHVYNSLNPPFHTPILLISQPCWTPKEHEKLTQFFFERFKTPAFAIMDAAMASLYAYGLPSATIVDVGLEKADITAISDFLIHDTGRVISLSGCGGEAFTQKLLELLKPKGFTREMCDQLKKSAICEILPVGTPLPGSSNTNADAITNPAAAASTGATGSGPGPAAALGNAPLGPGPDTEVGEEGNGEDNEGVLDVANIVASGKMNEYLAKKEKEKAEKAASKKKGGDTASSAAKPVRLPNSKRERNTFMFEDHALLDTLKGMNLNNKDLAGARAALDEGPKDHNMTDAPVTNGDANANEAHGASNGMTMAAAAGGPIRREIEVGIERFQAGTGGTLEKIADAIHRVISSVEEVNKRSELWESIVIVGNGAKVRGFRDALVSILQTKYLISPSSATIFTSELPSNLSTPAGTGANTPQPQMGLHGNPSSGVNPLLQAATTANMHLLHPNSVSGTPGLPGLNTPLHHSSHNVHSSHGQTPTAIKQAKPPEYFPEWKEVGFDEAQFLGAQVAAKVLFVVDQGQQGGKAYMTRPDYNEQGPPGIHDYVM